MQEIISKLQRHQNWKDIMRASCKQNGLKSAFANELTILKLKCLNVRLTKSYQTIGEKISTVWIQNELKTFHWLLIAISATDSIKISQFGNEQWSLLENIFQYKSRSFLKFQAQRLISSQHKKNKHWDHEQIQLLQRIIKQNSDEGYQWNDIARKMFQVSGESIFRTGKHCRERWLNHIDPSKNRGKWSSEQDLKLLTNVYKNGKKWSEYAIQFNRTQHSVKNRFNSIIMKQAKLTPLIKKQNKLILQAKKQIEINYHKQSEQIDDHSSEILPEKQQKEWQKSIQMQKRQCVSQQKYQKGQTIPILPVEQKSKSMEVLNEEQSNQNQVSAIILRYVKEEQELKKLVGSSELHPAIYSPYWSYSPNCTPNNFVNSPSPLSYYINYSFTNCFNNFTNQLHNFTVSKGEQNQ